MRSPAKLPKSRTGEFYHVRVREGEVGRYALLPGDPDRVPIIARFLDRSKQISAHREFTVYNGYAGQELVTVCSTGIGSPATAIAVEELARAGAHTFIRVGTCGAIRKDIELGDLIIAYAAVRMEGTSRQYVPIEYPAVADPYVVQALERAGKQLGHSYHVGLAASTDSFYVGQSRPGFRGYQTEESRLLLEELRSVGVLCFEMESATLFTVTSIYGLRSGAVLATIANRITDRFRYDGIENACQTAVEAVKLLASGDQSRGRGVMWAGRRTS